MFDGPLMLQVNWTMHQDVVDITRSKDNKFLLDMKIKATGDSKLNVSFICPTTGIFPYNIKVPASVIVSCNGC